MQVGLGPGHINLDGDPAPPTERGTAAPTLSKSMGVGFACVRVIRGPCVLWPKGWIDWYGLAIWYGGRPGHIGLDGDPAHPPQKGAQQPQFSAHVYCNQTVAHLSY